MDCDGQLRPTQSVAVDIGLGEPLLQARSPMAESSDDGSRNWTTSCKAFSVNVLAGVSTTLVAVLLVLLILAERRSAQQHSHMLRAEQPGQARPYPPTQEQACQDYLGLDITTKFGLILTADPGDFSGTSEAFHIIANLRHKKEKPRTQTVCGGFFIGTLMGQSVVVITTGIGPTAAGLCTEEVMAMCGSMVSSMVYFGTSGWSPQLGGILNPPDCSAANANNRITRIGDVCVSPFSVNWVCKKSTWSHQAQDYPNQCFRPSEVAGPNATYLYGECQFYRDNMDANLDLAEDIMAAVTSRRGAGNFPTRKPVVSGIESHYWQLMSQAAQHAYPQPDGQERPTIWDYTQCMEVDGQFFYTGVPWEIKARDYAAQTMNDALLPSAAPTRNKRFTPRTAADVIAVSAMEGVGVGEAMEKYNNLDSTRCKVPYTHIRTLSNYVHHPVAQVQNGVWDIFQEIPEDYVNGYAYAIATGSSVILSYYQARCLDGVRDGWLAANTDCSFTIDYK